LVRLLAGRQEAAQLAEIVILLGRNRPCVVDFVIQPRRRHEFQPRKALVIVVQDGIEGEPPAPVFAKAPADDGADLTRIDLGIPGPSRSS
jgi:hypothetical protein